MHEIRLRRPWQKRSKGAAEAIRIDVPEADAESNTPVASPATYQRNFNQPPGLDEPTRVYLRIEAWEGHLVALTINGHPLEATTAPLTREITEWLQPHNQIQLELSDTPQQRARLSGEVLLLIEE